MGTGLLLLLAFVAGLQVSSGTTDLTDGISPILLSLCIVKLIKKRGRFLFAGYGFHIHRILQWKLSTMGLKGTLSGDIGQLSELQILDLSYNNGLGGQLTANIGNLKKITTLILIGCSFSGNIPEEIGNLGNLSFLALNSNKFTGKIPASLGTLSNLYWLDVADNQLSGPIPISNNGAPGLDQLLHTKHFHLNKNQLSGPIPKELFSSNMAPIHVLFDGNQLTGEIPASIGLLKSLQVLRLDRNFLSGSVPSNINNLTNITELNLANNQLSGAMPNLTGMNDLNYVDLSNNTFDSSESPAWFSQIESLIALVIQSGGLYGAVPQKLFSFPQLQQVILDDNKFSGTLDMGHNSQQLQFVSFKNNNLESITLTSSYNETLILAGNPVCSNRLANIDCSLQERPSAPYSTSLTNCGPNQCSPDQSLSPSKCKCAYPYEGVMFFRGPNFRDVTNRTLFQELETSMWNKLGLDPGSVFLENPFFDADSYLRLQVKLFPSNGMYFSRPKILGIGFDLSNQTYKPPKIFGPYYFIASPYPFPDVEGRSSTSTGLITGIAVGCALLLLGLVVSTLYALRQKKRARRAMELSRPFASWTRSGEDSGGAPQLKGARWFSFDELKKSTNNFSETNEIGSGAYGKVYRGMLSSGQLVAIKRAQQGSKQGGLEFKTEIELLSRVHHKNLLGLVGFCFEEEEQMLVYEFMPNGTLREGLSGKSGVQLDWKRRIHIALGSARGLAYLHELADPPIIHRDVKSSNILLDENLTAKVADFGLSKLVSDSEKGYVSTQVKGTLGYVDPEYYTTQQLTEKSDVYSFGVVMLELITARKPIEKGKYIVREVKMAINIKDEDYYGLKEIMDPIIQNATYPVAFRRYVELAMRCVEESAADRPTMSNVAKEIETMLHDDGLNTNSNSASSSATDFGNTRGAPCHPYNDSLPQKDVSSSAFDYSGGYSLNLANNQLSGAMPNLTGMNDLNYVDLSNNTFDSSESPAWFSQIESLIALVIQSGGLYGAVPQKLFSFPQLQQVILDDNKFSGTLDMGHNSQQLQFVSFKNNNLESITLTSSYNETLILAGNPVCSNRLANIDCSLQERPSAPYSTSLTNCGPNQCSPDQSLSPSKCKCAYPYEGVMFFRGPNFRDVTNRTLFQELETSMWNKLGLDPGSVFLENPFFDADSYLRLQVKLFPSNGMYFSRPKILGIGFDLSNQTYKPPKIFGPYYFIASPYPFPDVEGRSSTSTGLITGIAVGCALLLLGLVVSTLYALRQKKRARRAMELSRPFASWTRSGEDSGGAPQLKGARWFSFDELKKSTNNFSETNEIGSGAYGKVYRGMLSSGQLVAIKRAQQGSKQGGLEFKTEIELLSRVHHKNLLGLVGFCFEEEEQMLVYEFMPNGTLREGLSGKSGVQLDWKRRIHIALGSARGLAYLHELADPPIIHRDVKSSNILLDENLTAKVADFGLSKLVSDSEKGYVSTQVKGTLGYVDPEYYTTQQLTEKSDVYSFGVVMLELITARKPIEKGKYIVREVKMAINIKDEDYYGLKEIMDPIIQNATYPVAFRRYVELAMRCVEESAADRPTMSNVAKEIETMLHDDGLNTNSNSASSSATDFGNTRGAPCHPYNDSLPQKDVSSSAFDYSGGYSLSANPEPK
ncbi:putative leucine-rich repeat receptor-like protein kinase [Cocos nucifera]|nr:putative leucine-rich repeat receptor-like protein kinase [Cocos nucifera]